MSEKEHREFYKTLKPVFCPALQETIYFNAHGLHHLYYKDFRRRPFKEVVRKLALLPYAHKVISTSSQALKRTRPEQPDTETWSVENTIVKEDGTRSRIRAILIRKKPSARLYFLSIMDYAN